MARNLKIELTAEQIEMARREATHRYTETIQEQRNIRKLFPGVDQAAQRQLVVTNLERARAARKYGRRRTG